MTDQEAIRELHNIRPRGGIIPQKRADALDVAIKALEKQIAKKPNTAIDTTWGIKREVPVCPVCDYYLTETHWLIWDEANEGKKVSYCETCRLRRCRRTRIASKKSKRP